MASPFAALLSQSSAVKTRKGLILTGLQNDFLSPEGKLPVSISTGFVDRLQELVKDFRDYGDVIWVRSHFVENRAVNQDDEFGDTVVVGSGVQDVPRRGSTSTPVRDRPSATESGDDDDDDPPSPKKKARLSADASQPPPPVESVDAGSSSHEASEPDEELFLTRTADREPCCIPDSFGADYATQIKDLVDARRDLQLIKTYYSAFSSTSLLMTLRTKLVTELYICGCTTNLSLFATAMDAARHGIRITLIDDLLGYRKKDRHDEAIKQLREIMGARLMSSNDVIRRLKDPSVLSDEEDEDAEEEAAAEEGTDAIAFDPLAVDSDTDGDEALLPTSVRTPFSHGRASAVPNARILGASSHTAALKAEQPPGIEPREPRSAREADVRRCQTTNQPTAANTQLRGSSSGYGEDHDAGWIGRATASRSSVAEKNESTDGVIPALPWGVIDKEWAAKDEERRKLSAQSNQSAMSTMSAAAAAKYNTVDEDEKPTADAKFSNNEEASPQIPQSRPLLGEDKEEESAGSRIYYNLLPTDLAETIFNTLNSEISWQKMHHQTGEVPRLVSCQSTIAADGSSPVYRHPSDRTLPTSPWTPAVTQIRQAAEHIVGHPLNHALIQLYRGGTDYISEHSDKTLDIAANSSIVNVSFGAQRMMRLRTKRVASTISSPSSPAAPRTTYRTPMPHNSMLTMTLPTNAAYLHGIMADKRPRCELLPTETAFSGQRISLTFRNIATFLTADEGRIWGQGATAKTREEAKEVVSGDAEESERLVRAFGRENAATEVEWEEIYGDGFDVLHLK